MFLVSSRYNRINFKKGGESMVDSTKTQELDAAIEKLNSYVASNYGTKASYHYFSVMKGLRRYAWF